MISEEKFISFEEFYYLEEGFADYFRPVMDKIKSLGDFLSNVKNYALSTDESGQIKNTKKLKNKWDEFISIIKGIKTVSPYAFEIILAILRKKTIKTMNNLPPMMRVFVAAIPTLVALLGAYLFYQTKEARLLKSLGPQKPPTQEQLVEAIRDAVEHQSPPSVVDNQKREELNKNIAEEIKWGSFENRKDFVNAVKKFESDSGNPLAAYFDRTQTSIGFGTKAKKGEKTLTPTEAHNRLIDELEEHQKLVHNIISKVKPTWKLNQKQWNALIDISFNIGSGDLTKILKNVSKKQQQGLRQLSDEVSTITHATRPDGSKVKSPNLIQRRVWEKSMLL